jgi:hypothetical protein
LQDFYLFHPSNRKKRVPNELGDGADGGDHRLQVVALGEAEDIR